MLKLYVQSWATGRSRPPSADFKGGVETITVNQPGQADQPVQMIQRVVHARPELVLVAGFGRRLGLITGSPISTSPLRHTPQKPEPCPNGATIRQVLTKLAPIPTWPTR